MEAQVITFFKFEQNLLDRLPFRNPSIERRKISTIYGFTYAYGTETKGRFIGNSQSIFENYSTPVETFFAIGRKYDFQG